MPLSPGTRCGHDNVTSLLEDGGMGQVGQATDTQPGRQVAQKILPDWLARFEREAKVPKGEHDQLPTECWRLR